MSYRKGILDQQFKNVSLYTDIDNKSIIINNKPSTVNEINVIFDKPQNTTNNNIIINNEPSIIKDFNNLVYAYSSQLVKTVEDINNVQNNFISFFGVVSSGIIETINEVDTIQANLSSNWQNTSDQTYNNILPKLDDLNLQIKVVDAGFF